MCSKEVQPALVPRGEPELKCRDYRYVDRQPCAVSRIEEGGIENETIRSSVCIVSCTDHGKSLVGTGERLQVMTCTLKGKEGYLCFVYMNMSGKARGIKRLDEDSSRYDSWTQKALGMDVADVLDVCDGLVREGKL